MKTFIYQILIFCWLAIAPIHSIIYVLGFLISIDLLTGIWKAIKAGEKIESKKLANTVSKALLYQLFLISGFLIETYIDSTIPLSKIISYFIATIELKSISENILTITGINFMDVLKEYFQRKQK